MTDKTRVSRPSRRSVSIRGAAAATFLALALSACKDPKPPQRPTPVVSIAPVTLGPLPYIVTANGEVEPNRTVSVQSLVSGMLTRVAIEEGQEVAQGQVLFEIDPRPFQTELDRARGTLQRDEAQLASLRADSARFAALAKDGYITRQQLDQTFGQVNALVATVASDRAAVEGARLNVNNSIIRAPISGRTGQLAIRAGNIVRAQSEPPLVVINELAPVLVRFSVPERDFQEMRRRAGLDKALPVRVRAGESDSARTVMGTLAFIDNTVDRATGSVLLKARVENRDHQLWPGQFVTVALELSVDQNAITVPTEAVVTNATGSFVFVVDDSMRVIRTPIKLGRSMGLTVKIDSGLVGNERIVTEGQTRLSDRAKVQARDTSPAAASGRGRRGGRGGRGAPGGPGADTGRAGGSRGGRADSSARSGTGEGRGGRTR